MSILSSPHLLRRVLLLDALTSGATGLLLLLGGGLLAPWLGLPDRLLHGASGLLLPFAALVAWTGSRPALPRPGAWAVAILNLLWVLGSLGLLLSGWVQPTGLGIAFVIAQALVVGLLAELQVIGLRRRPDLAV